MRTLEGKTAIVTGAGRGLGKSHALALAREGAAVIVNDLGSSLGGDGQCSEPSEEVAALIRSEGGCAVANSNDCSDWEGARSIITQAVEQFGSLDILVNNAGIIRDRMCFNMAEAEFDDVVRVHLKGHFAMSRHAAAYWRDLRKLGHSVSGRIINTTSEAGLYGTPGQANYAAAKAGIIAMTLSIGRELGPIGVTANAISPRAETRFTAGLEGATRTSAEAVSPLVVWLAGEGGASTNGKVFVVHGGYLACMSGWGVRSSVVRTAPLTLADMPAVMDRLLPDAGARGMEALPL